MKHLHQITLSKNYTQINALEWSVASYTINHTLSGKDVLPYTFGASSFLNVGRLVLGRVVFGASCLGASCFLGELSVIRLGCFNGPRNRAG